MPRGGRRIGAGGRFKWNSGKTKVVRIPEALADQVIEFAVALDKKTALVPVTSSSISTKSGYDDVTASKVINLSGISIRAFQDGPGIYLADLIRVGYEIQPSKLVQSFKIKESQEKQDRAISVKKEVDAALKKIESVKKIYD